eukprot:CAMPEP_0172548966 /NCGR_PEP_ID=MMETSP1067-20121228/18159_1 /TAXON_ID=265564 ORGANISM="Thalassiosira punctigera, Strain Tpunct2005C2" /NCGR_SAMPLE_ID=MMETSP1067 /ASSEMBLY_ACC=CAM_ASM_000444 /LENGTH=66 /DNA_ID=CAMNT_0013336275 /DNA_START=68 /DNA_END=264 /DNA_ORIENTATION=-
MPTGGGSPTSWPPDPSSMDPITVADPVRRVVALPSPPSPPLVLLATAVEGLAVSCIKLKSDGDLMP